MRLLVDRVRSGRPEVHIAAEMASRGRRLTSEYAGAGGRRRGLHNRPSRPHTPQHCTLPGLEKSVCRLRGQRKLGLGRTRPRPARLDRAPHPASARPKPFGLAGPPHRRTGPPLRTRPTRRADAPRSKKLGNIPDGDGWRTVGTPDGDRNQQATTDQRNSTKPVIEQLYALRRRRPLPPDLHRSPADERQHTASPSSLVTASPPSVC